MKHRYACLLLLVLLPALPVAAQTTVELTPARDNTLFESSTGTLSNGVGTGLFAGKTSSGLIRRALLAFDLSSIPPGSIIESATLSMTVSQTVAGDQTVMLHRVTADWGEGTSNSNARGGGQGAGATAGDATWLHRFFATDFWATPGGDFDPAVSATATVGFQDRYTWGPSDQMTADIQAWLDDPAANFGWIVIGNESANQTAKRFDSREHAVSSNRPVLSVTFSLPTATEDEAVPDGFRLDQNYPNPFNPSTTIRYTLGAPQAVQLRVYDLLGREVAVLVDGPRAAGEHTVVFEAGDLPGGLYLYRLETPRFRRTRTLTLLK